MKTRRATAIRVHRMREAQRQDRGVHKQLSERPCDVLIYEYHYSDTKPDCLFCGGGTFIHHHCGFPYGSDDHCVYHWPNVHINRSRKATSTTTITEASNALSGTWTYLSIDPDPNLSIAFALSDPATHITDNYSKKSSGEAFVVTTAENCYSVIHGAYY